MAGRWKNIVATTIAAALYPGIVAATQPGGPVASAIPRPGLAAPAEMRFDHVDADSRFSWAAAASRMAFDPLEARNPLFARRFDARAAGDAEVSRARLGFDWQRLAGAARLHASAQATGARLDLPPDAATAQSSLDERYERHDRSTRTAAALRLEDRLALFGLRSAGSVGLRLQADAFDGRDSLRNAFHHGRDDVHAGGARQSRTSVEAARRFDLPGGIQVDGRWQLDDLRLDVATPGVRDQVLDGLRSAGELRVSAPLRRGVGAFAAASRGAMADGFLAAVDPRNGTLLGVIDPASGSRDVVAGLDLRPAAGWDARIAAWRSRSAAELRFTGDESWSSLARSAVRQGMNLAVRYHPVRWLSVEAQAIAMRARFADGALEPIGYSPERLATAGATLRGVGGWTASLFVSYLGPRQAVDDDLARLRSSTLVNGRVVHNLSKRTRLTLDVFNVFNQPVAEIDQFAASRLAGPATHENFLFHPAEPRGFRLRVRTTF